MGFEAKTTHLTMEPGLGALVLRAICPTTKMVSEALVFKAICLTTKMGSGAPVIKITHPTMGMGLKIPVLKATFSTKEMIPREAPATYNTMKMVLGFEAIHLAMEMGSREVTVPSTTQQTMGIVFREVPLSRITQPTTTIAHQGTL